MPDPAILTQPGVAPFAAVAILLAGIVAGAFVARAVLPSRKQLRKLTAELEKLRADHQTYRTNVTRHFETTSELVATMTASYKAVYDHLATGARSLCEPTKTLAPGEFGAPRLVFDEKLDLGAASPTPEGRATREGPAGDAAGAPASERVTTEESTQPTASDHEPPTLEMTKHEPEEQEPSEHRERASLH
jgi:hypothetical protein